MHGNTLTQEIKAQEIWNLIFNETIENLNNIARWNKNPILMKESVAQHSFWVTFFTAMLCGILREGVAFRYQAIMKAIFHDFEEMFSGDVLFELKGSVFGNELKTILQNFAKNEIDSNFDNGDLFRDYFKTYNLNIETLKLKHVYKTAEYMACIMYVNKEVKLGNSYMKPKLEICVEELRAGLILLRSHYPDDHAFLDKFDEIISDYLTLNNKQV